MKGASVLEPKKNAGRMARLGVLAALLIAAGILVWQKPLSAVPQPQQPEAAVSPAPTVSGRNAREASYEKDMAALQALTENEQLQQAVRDQAAEQLNRMVQNHQTELAIEEALQKAGFAPFWEKPSLPPDTVPRLCIARRFPAHRSLLFRPDAPETLPLPEQRPAAPAVPPPRGPPPAGKEQSFPAPVPQTRAAGQSRRKAGPPPSSG